MLRRKFWVVIQHRVARVSVLIKIMRRNAANLQIRWDFRAEQQLRVQVDVKQARHAALIALTLQIMGSVLDLLPEAPLQALADAIVKSLVGITAIKIPLRA